MKSSSSEIRGKSCVSICVVPNLPSRLGFVDHRHKVVRINYLGFRDGCHCVYLHAFPEQLGLVAAEIQ